MTIYTVLAPPTKDESARPDPDRFVFVKEGFCWPAFYLTIPWLIWRQMWLVLFFYLVATVALLALAGRAPTLIAFTMVVAFGVLVGLEANNLRRWTLERRGHRFVGAVEGDRLNEAEYRFFANWTRPEPAPRPNSKTAGPGWPKGTAKPPGTLSAGSDIVGLFPMPGARP